MNIAFKHSVFPCEETRLFKQRTERNTELKSAAASLRSQTAERKKGARRSKQMIKRANTRCVPTEWIKHTLLQRAVSWPEGGRVRLWAAGCEWRCKLGGAGGGKDGRPAVTPCNRDQHASYCTARKWRRRSGWSWGGISWFFPSTPRPWPPDLWRGPSGSLTYTEKRKELPKKKQKASATFTHNSKGLVWMWILRKQTLNSPWRAAAPTSRGTSSGLFRRLWWRWLGRGLGCCHPFRRPPGSEGRLG